MGHNNNDLVVVGHNYLDQYMTSQEEAVVDHNSQGLVVMDHNYQARYMMVHNSQGLVATEQIGIG